MPRYRIMIARPVGSGSHRHEVGSFLAHCVEQIHDPRSSVYDLVETLPDGSRYFNVPVQAFPTSVARNQVVALAQKFKVDFLLMVDDDAYPPHGFFEHAFHFLRQQPVPSVIAAPYCSGDGEVQVFQFTTQQPVQAPLDAWALTRIPRTDALQRKGTERVASLGTHLIAYDVRAFDRIQKPYYAYGYNDDHTRVTETEDCYCHRHLFNAGVPLYASWDHWACHWKMLPVGTPEPLTLEQIPSFWREKAITHLLYTQEGQQQLEEARLNRQINAKLADKKIPDTTEDSPLTTEK